jgi:two-component system, OmpR family, KDP operon response regulator KdpE
MTYKILLVDDDPTLLRFLHDYLTEEAFTVIYANNGTEGLRLAYREHPDLVLLDVMMPVMDGWEVCARLREMSDVPIILLTAKSSEGDKLRGFRLGVDDFVTKPFSFAELTARVNAVLARTQKPQATERSIVKFGALLLDLDRRELRRGEALIPLTPTEYRMLEFIGRNQGRAVSEAELMQEVWGNYRQEDTVAVRRYIWLLRQKIEADPANPVLILTVRGFGYRLGTGSLKSDES